MRWLPHVHWAQDAGMWQGRGRESCRCGRHRLIVFMSGVPVYWTGWHGTPGEAETQLHEWEGGLQPSGSPLA